MTAHITPIQDIQTPRRRRHHDYQQQQQKQPEIQGQATHRQLGGAAAAGGILGLMVAGPVMGVAAGIVAAVASTRKSKAGQVARAAGDVTATAGEKLKEFDRKHHVVEKTSNAIVKGCEKMNKKLQPRNNTAANSEINTTV